MKDCVFCRIVAGELPADRVYEDDEVVAFLDIAPLAKGHTLIVPKEHHTSITTVPPKGRAAMMTVAPTIGAAMMRVTDGDGFNLILSNGACAGQVVPHAHLHVVPRHADDSLVLPTATVPYDSDDERLEVLNEARSRLEERGQ